MMNRAEMVKPREASLPIFIDQQVRDIFRRKIEFIRRHVELPVRIGSPYNSPLDSHQHLFSFTSEECSSLEDRDWKITGRAKSDRLQALGLEVMKEYGLDENISQPEYHNGRWTKDGIIDDGDGTSREMRLYQSQTIDGLAFARTKKFVTTTNEALEVSWRVVDNAPLFRINLGKKAKK